MPPHPPARLTKKQRKATVFRERGKKSKGAREGLGKPNPAPGRSRRPSAGDSGEPYDHDEDHYDEDANAVPAMEDQDQALAEMAGDTEASARAYEGHAAKVQKAAEDSMATQKKRDKDKDRDKKRRRGAVDDGMAGPARKKARISRGSDEIPPPPAREEDGDRDEGMSVSVLEDGEGGHESETKDKGGKPQRYILFIGMSYHPPPFPYNHSASFVATRRRESQVHNDARRNPEPFLPVRCVLFPFPPSFQSIPH